VKSNKSDKRNNIMVIGADLDFIVQEFSEKAEIYQEKDKI